MHIALLSSRLDPAGTNLARRLKELLREREDWPLLRAADLTFHETEGRLIYAEEVDRDFGADLLVFLSRHTSTHPVPALTVHVTGNFGEAVYGGAARTLPPAAPAMMHAVLRGLARHAPPGYRAGYEATHHGPTALSTPSLFVEIGSTETEWNDPAAADAAARAVLEAVPAPVIPLVGFGGTHYAVRQTEITLTSRGAFGHIAPSRVVPDLDRALIAAMVEETGAVAAYLDRKALSRDEITTTEAHLSALDVPVLSEGEITEIGTLSWETYTALRAAAEQTVPGGRVHPGGLEGEGEFIEAQIPEDLVREAERTDPHAFRDGLDRLSAAFIATPTGTTAPSFITFKNQSEEIIHDVISLCIKIIDVRWSTAADGDDLVITRTRFDPGKARALGVPKGPLFGKLSSGRAVEIGDATVTPSMVQSSSVTRIHIPGLERYINEVHC
ncbi:D-tyrosyl-tRNA(Tyr) deacylase [Methanofollis formosanus]|uniref:D-aminoacyl-tRNA deacylase n=1 Tax=Methanofollis formosanus TaxID=299308 RepID=A0A8G1A0U0_9EURY|nr:D-aminoacyl-tRNA deacylase [Methanofollis formosanus]QYZ78950.1 D-tyrosyl-tRNA(Tyr) deacylase [Methanofollis formosanus]